MRFAIVFISIFAAGCASGPKAGDTANRAQAASALQSQGTLLQVMRGVLFPAANVIYAAQSDPTTVKADVDPSVSPNPLASTYGQWTAAENAGIALAEASTLILMPRACSNRRPAPVN